MFKYVVPALLVWSTPFSVVHTFLVCLWEYVECDEHMRAFRVLYTCVYLVEVPHLTTHSLYINRKSALLTSSTLACKARQSISSYGTNAGLSGVYNYMYVCSRSPTFQPLHTCEHMGTFVCVSSM